MKKNDSSHDQGHGFRRCVRACWIALLVVVPVGVTAQAVATPAVSAPSIDSGLFVGAGLGLRLGYNSKYRQASLVYETPTFWSHQLQNGWGMLGIGVEFGVSYWKASKHREPDSMWQLSAVPMVRWWPNNSFYLEGGFGPTVLSRSEFAGRDLSTRMQFGTHLGIGTLINKVHRVSLRYSHYSNANIKKPNPGLDLLELSYTYRF